MKITRKNIKACAKFFPGLYEISEYTTGFEVTSLLENYKCSVFFWNDRRVTKSDTFENAYVSLLEWEGARMLGMMGEV